MSFSSIIWDQLCFKDSLITAGSTVKGLTGLKKYITSFSGVSLCSQYQKFESEPSGFSVRSLCFSSHLQHFLLQRWKAEHKKTAIVAQSLSTLWPRFKPQPGQLLFFSTQSLLFNMHFCYNHSAFSIHGCIFAENAFSSLLNVIIFPLLLRHL